MESFLVATGLVALAEIGDKTQLLAFMLAARYHKPIPIILGILVATLANHALAAAIGTALTSLIAPDTLRYLLAASFIAMGIWVLIPDKLDDDGLACHSHWGVFTTTLVAFFLAEMGDKTQIATVALAAQASSFVAVVAGTTVGMMIANVPAALISRKLLAKLPVRTIHICAALLFIALGGATLLLPTS
ncbi:MAG: TMEM165/GDT1 family protein [Gammaproteobacteria bacterium]|nr:TMEM165/GDT1 family protein [Gammaproteobacteria bacterium]